MRKKGKRQKTINAYSWHTINDPVHKTMNFSSEEKNLIRPFIDNKLFQRLRGIKQMGLADYVFPGAVHTRFNHSLGACHLACHVLNKINGKIEIFDLKEKAFILAALLHDIGHGPFSHAFEEIYKVNNEEKFITHEHWSLKFIQHLLLDDQNLRICYNDLNHKRLKKSNISKTKNELKEIFNHIKNIFNHDRNEPDLFYSTLISSQLDVDRMDYLVRDSYFCGVEYGTYDVDWLINSFCVASGEDGQKRLCINPKGIGVVEHLLLSRFLIRKHVCLNKKVQSAEYLMMEFIKIIYRSKNIRNQLRNTIFGGKDCNLFAFLEILFSKIEDNTAKKENKKNAILDEGFDSYKLLTDADIFLLIQKVSEIPLRQNKKLNSLIQIADRFVNRRLPDSYILINDKKYISESVIKQFKSKHSSKYDDWQINYQEAIVPTCYRPSEEKILIAANDSSSTIKHKLLIVSNIEKQSEIINRVSNLEDRVFFLFIDKDIAKKQDIQKLIEEIKTNSCATFFR